MANRFLGIAGKLCLVFGFVTIAISSSHAISKTRMIIMADMGNEPDEMQQNMHLFMYANEIDIEGLIAVSGLYLKTSVKPQLYDSLIRGYRSVYDSLMKHASGWPTPDYLQSITKGGFPAYGIGAIGPGKSSGGSDLIKSALLKNDPRPLYFIGNAGTNTLAQALYELNLVKTQNQMDSLCQKMIVYENGSQDDAGAWIMLRFPKIRWHRSNNQTYAYAGGTTPYTYEPFAQSGYGQHDWATAHIQRNHGLLGTMYPDRFGRSATLEGGGTTPWIGLVNHGLFDAEKMYWGGWGGRFSRDRHSTATDPLVWSKHTEISPSEKQQVKDFGKDFSMYLADVETDTWTDPTYGNKYSGTSTCVNRWRRAEFNDFRGRMDWCVKPYAQADHNPKAVFNGDAGDSIIMMQVKPGQVVPLDASASTDPDGDPIKFSWYVYPEAGTYKGNLSLTNNTQAKTSITIPADADMKEIHLILEVRDSSKVKDTSGILSMYDYRRIVFNVSSTTGVIQSQAGSSISDRTATFMTTGDRIPLPAAFRNQTCKLFIFNLSGTCVIKTIVNNTVISLSKDLHLKSGTYLVRLEQVK